MEDICVTINKMVDGRRISPGRIADAAIARLSGSSPSLLLEQGHLFRTRMFHDVHRSAHPEYAVNIWHVYRQNGAMLFPCHVSDTSKFILVLPGVILEVVSVPDGHTVILASARMAMAAVEGMPAPSGDFEDVLKVQEAVSGGGCVYLGRSKEAGR